MKERDKERQRKSEKARDREIREMAKEEDKWQKKQRDTLRKGEIEEERKKDRETVAYSFTFSGGGAGAISLTCSQLQVVTTERKILSDWKRVWKRETERAEGKEREIWP